MPFDEEIVLSSLFEDIDNRIKASSQRPIHTQNSNPRIALFASSRGIKHFYHMNDSIGGSCGSVTGARFMLCILRVSSSVRNVIGPALESL